MCEFGKILKFELFRSFMILLIIVIIKLIILQIINFVLYQRRKYFMTGDSFWMK